MKKNNLIIAIIAMVTIAGCKNGKQAANELITIDVGTNYLEKELILQDFMDVEYIALETNDEFITQGRVLDVGSDMILVSNRVNDGNIFLFDRKTGKGLRRINRRGQGNEEYLNATVAILDEVNGEIFVKDFSARRFLVYDLHGNFQRRFAFVGDNGRYSTAFNYDQNSLLVYNSFPVALTGNQASSFLIISKQDGSLVQEIEIPVKEFGTPTVAEMINGELFTISFHYFPIVPYRDGWALMQTSSDTIYHYTPSSNILAPLIARTPSIHAMSSQVFLFPGVLTDRYYFFQTLQKGVNFETMRGLPRTNLVYDRQEGTAYKATVYNGDFSTKRQVGMWSNPANHEVATHIQLEAHVLVEAHEKGELKGELKEIASRLDPEDNPVIMLVKHRK